MVRSLPVLVVPVVKLVLSLQWSVLNLHDETDIMQFLHVQVLALSAQFQEKPMEYHSPLHVNVLRLPEQKSVKILIHRHSMPNGLDLIAQEFHLFEQCRLLVHSAWLKYHPLKTG
ncbi:hypothetical protein D9M70_567930 [compost metagenome]